MKIFNGTYYNEILNFIKEEKERADIEAADTEVTDETEGQETEGEPAPVSPEEAQTTEQPVEDQVEQQVQDPAAPQQDDASDQEKVNDAAMINPEEEQKAANTQGADPTITQSWQAFAKKYNEFKKLYDTAGFKSWEEFIEKVNAGDNEEGGEQQVQ